MSSQTDRGVSGPYVTAQAMEGPPIEKPFWRPNRVFKEIVLQPHAAQAASDGNSPSSLEEESPGDSVVDLAGDSPSSPGEARATSPAVAAEKPSEPGEDKGDVASTLVENPVAPPARGTARVPLSARWQEEGANDATAVDEEMPPIAGVGIKATGSSAAQDGMLSSNRGTAARAASNGDIPVATSSEAELSAAQLGEAPDGRSKNEDRNAMGMPADGPAARSLPGARSPAGSTSFPRKMPLPNEKGANSKGSVALAAPVGDSRRSAPAHVATVAPTGQIFTPGVKETRNRTNASEASTLKDRDTQPLPQGTALRREGEHPNTPLGGSANGAPIPSTGAAARVARRGSINDQGSAGGGAAKPKQSHLDEARDGEGADVHQTKSNDGPLQPVVDPVEATDQEGKRDATEDARDKASGPPARAVTRQPFSAGRPMVPLQAGATTQAAHKGPGTFSNEAKSASRPRRAETRSSRPSSAAEIPPPRSSKARPAFSEAVGNTQTPKAKEASSRPSSVSASAVAAVPIAALSKAPGMSQDSEGKESSIVDLSGDASDEDSPDTPVVIVPRGATSAVNPSRNPDMEANDQSKHRSQRAERAKGSTQEMDRVDSVSNDRPRSASTAPSLVANETAPRPQQKLPPQASGNAQSKEAPSAMARPAQPSVAARGQRGIAGQEASAETAVSSESQRPDQAGSIQAPQGLQSEYRDSGRSDTNVRWSAEKPSDGGTQPSEQAKEAHPTSATRGAEEVAVQANREEQAGRQTANKQGTPKTIAGSNEARGKAVQTTVAALAPEGCATPQQSGAGASDEVVFVDETKRKRPYEATGGDPKRGRWEGQKATPAGEDKGQSPPLPSLQNRIRDKPSTSSAARAAAIANQLGIARNEARRRLELAFGGKSPSVHSVDEAARRSAPAGGERLLKGAAPQPTINAGYHGLAAFQDGRRPNGPQTGDSTFHPAVPAGPPAGSALSYMSTGSSALDPRPANQRLLSSSEMPRYLRQQWRDVSNNQAGLQRSPTHAAHPVIVGGLGSGSPTNAALHRRTASTNPMVSGPRSAVSVSALSSTGASLISAAQHAASAAEAMFVRNRRRAPAGSTHVPFSGPEAHGLGPAMATPQVAPAAPQLHSTRMMGPARGAAVVPSVSPTFSTDAWSAPPSASAGAVSERTFQSPPTAVSHAHVTSRASGDGGAAVSGPFVSEPPVSGTALGGAANASKQVVAEASKRTIRTFPAAATAWSAFLPKPKVAEGRRRAPGKPSEKLAGDDIFVINGKKVDPEAWIGLCTSQTEMASRCRAKSLVKALRQSPSLRVYRGGDAPEGKAAGTSVQLPPPGEAATKPAESRGKVTEASADPASLPADWSQELQSFADANWKGIRNAVSELAAAIDANYACDTDPSNVIMRSGFDAAMDVDIRFCPTHRVSCILLDVAGSLFWRCARCNVRVPTAQPDADLKKWQVFQRWGHRCLFLARKADGRYCQGLVQLREAYLQARTKLEDLSSQWTERLRKLLHHLVISEEEGAYTKQVRQVAALDDLLRQAITQQELDGKQGYERPTAEFVGSVVDSFRRKMNGLNKVNSLVKTRIEGLAELERLLAKPIEAGKLQGTAPAPGGPTRKRRFSVIPNDEQLLQELQSLSLQLMRPEQSMTAAAQQLHASNFANVPGLQEVCEEEVMWDDRHRRRAPPRPSPVFSKRRKLIAGPERAVPKLAGKAHEAGRAPSTAASAASSPAGKGAESVLLSSTASPDRRGGREEESVAEDRSRTPRVADRRTLAGTRRSAAEKASQGQNRAAASERVEGTVSRRWSREIDSVQPTGEEATQSADAESTIAALRAENRRLKDRLRRERFSQQVLLERVQKLGEALSQATRLERAAATGTGSRIHDLGAAIFGPDFWDEVVGQEP